MSKRIDMGPLLAARDGDARRVGELLAAGADPNEADVGSGYTPLTHAVENGHAALLDPLLAAGADPREPDRRGRTPRERAEQARDEGDEPRRYDGVLRLLADAEAADAVT